MPGSAMAPSFVRRTTAGYGLGKSVTLLQGLIPTRESDFKPQAI